MLPGTHRLRVFALDQSAPRRRTQQTPAHLGLDSGDGLGTDAPGFVKTRTARANRRFPTALTNRKERV